MSKYNSLWLHLGQTDADSLLLTFEEISEISGVALDHSFLKYKIEAAAFGWEVGKISLKEKTVAFRRLESKTPSRQKGTATAHERR